MSLFLRRFTAVDQANGKSYYSLIEHQSALKSHIDRSQNNTTEIENYLDSFDHALHQPNVSWVLGKGYIELWDLMNSAEEALINSAPLDKVIADAINDEMRLNNSHIENSEEWANKLRIAVSILNPDAVRYLKPSLGSQSLKGANDQSTQSPDQGSNPTAQPSTSDPAVNQNGTAQAQVSVQGGNAGGQQKLMARSILRTVRETINEFNANSWTALINARNQLYSTMTLVGLTMFVFVALAVLVHVNQTHLEAATFYAFIGGIAGLVGRLSVESQSDKTVDDYRLSQARLMVTPLLSSLAAVLGVLLVAKVTDLNSIYSINANLVPNLIIAAAFGLSPNLLINQIQNKANVYQGNLQSTQPTSGK